MTDPAPTLKDKIVAKAKEKAKEKAAEPLEKPIDLSKPTPTVTPVDIGSTKAPPSKATCKSAEDAFGEKIRAGLTLGEGTQVDTVGKYEDGSCHVTTTLSNPTTGQGVIAEATINPGDKVVSLQYQKGSFAKGEVRPKEGVLADFPITQAGKVDFKSSEGASKMNGAGKWDPVGKDGIPADMKPALGVIGAAAVSYSEKLGLDVKVDKPDFKVTAPGIRR